MDSHCAALMERYESVFQGLGQFGEPYTIRLRPDAKPVCIYTPRRVPFPLRSRVKDELDRMMSMGVISPVDQPTDWCSGMVAVPKKSGSVRICVDLQRLNESVLREIHPLPRVDETLAQLAGARVFSKLDANSGFWQIPLDEKSRLLTTFLTPFGRYCFNKLPFGICSASEHFQKEMSRVLEGLEGVVCQVDDVLVHAPDQKTHDARLSAVLARLKEKRVTLNKEKCSFSQPRLKFLGHMVDEHGVSADPEKTAAVSEMSPPRNTTELRRFLGLANQLGKFSPNLAELSQPLRELLKKDRAWFWGPSQEDAFTRVKKELTLPTVLALYDPALDVKVSADASSFGLGAVLLQRHGKDWRPVVYASRSMTEAEKRYAQIEKEALATVWSCEKFEDYVMGKQITIETDHKPLVPLLNSKHLDALPPRILRFRLRMARFSYMVIHVPGKLLYVADALSRAPLPPLSSLSPTQNELEQEAELYMDAVVAGLPASKGRLKEYCDAQASDPVCSDLIQFCKSGWPVKSKLPARLKPYWEAQHKITFNQSQGILLYEQRIIVPAALQQVTLERVHDGHQGIQRCRLRVKNSVWWPGVSSQIKYKVQNCTTCSKYAVPHHEPMIASLLPDRPWESLGADLFHLNGSTYLLLVDYFSRYPEVIKLSTLTASSVISAAKGVFSRHGIPDEFRSDNGPQFDSEEFEQFAKQYGFEHKTSSPYYPQGNALAERTVQTVKNLLKKSKDPHMALLAYRSTPLPWCGLSPSQLLMGRTTKCSLPQTRNQLAPKWSYLNQFRIDDVLFRKKQVEQYNERHRVHLKQEITKGSPVWVTTNGRKIQGQVNANADTPRSYVVITADGGTLRRNSRHLVPTGESVTPTAPEPPQPVQPPSHQMPTRSPVLTRTRTNTKINRPLRYGD